MSLDTKNRLLKNVLHLNKFLYEELKKESAGTVHTDLKQNLN